MATKVIIGVSDLLFQSRIEGAARLLGLEVVIADTAPTLAAAIDHGAELAVIDVNETAFDACDAIRIAGSGGARVLAFGRHTSPGELRAAREAGAEIVVPRSELASDLSELLRRLLPVPETDAS
jgi:hypothetical protein